MFDGLKKTSRRKALTGKRVKIVSHAGPELRKRVGTIEDVIHNGQVVRLSIDAIGGYKEGDSAYTPPLAPALFVTMSIDGVQLLEK